ncbi:MAG: DUF4924 family protein [Rikenellaceae bacterium]
MDIARSLRRTNIAEYILYLWQLEDLLRSVQFSPEAIYTKFVQSRTDLSPEQQHALLSWYVELGELLEREGKREIGHSDHTLHLIADLNDLHLRLQELPIGARFRTLWVTTKEALPDLRAAIGDNDKLSDISDVELCFRALYASILYRIKGVDGRNAVEHTLAYVSPLIAELAKIYGEVEQGEIDLFSND